MYVETSCNGDGGVVRDLCGGVSPDQRLSTVLDGVDAIDVFVLESVEAVVAIDDAIDLVGERRRAAGYHHADGRHGPVVRTHG